jgi:hypothetical protein
MWYRLYAYSWKIDQDAITSWIRLNSHRTVKIKYISEYTSIKIIQFKFRHHQDAVLFRMFHQEIETKQLSTGDDEWKAEFGRKVLLSALGGISFKTGSKLRPYVTGKTYFAFSQLKSRYDTQPGGVYIDYGPSSFWIYNKHKKYKQKKQKHRKANRS